MIYLGTLGRMIGIKCPASQSVDTEERYTPFVTLEGRRKMQVRPVSRRTWSLQTSEAHTPADVSAVQHFAQGAWGKGPFWFVSAEAAYSNLLLPSVARCDILENPSGFVVEGGPQLIGGVWFPRSYLNTSSVTMFFGSSFASGAVPVASGVKVTGSAYVSGSGSLCRVTFYDVAGNAISSHDSSIKGAGAGFVRSWVAAVPPANAVSARIFAVSAVRATGPAITWTDSLVPWSSGSGCNKAVVQDGSMNLTLTGARGTYMGLSYNVLEVG